MLLAAGAEGYQWPLDVPPQVTGTFGEFRSGRLHTGTDLHTGGNGFPVRAPLDGQVERVRCSPYGFGKAVYLRLTDGRMAVFGHLSDFREDLREYVREAQHAAKDYSVELTPEPGRFPVRRGEEIARSGDTGMGPSHLHFELRDAADHPINPRLAGYGWPDKRTPVLNKAIVVPENPEARVNGGLDPVVVDLFKDKQGRYTCAPVRVKGRFGVGIDLVDPTPAGDKLGIYSARLLDGERACFEVRHDLISYEHVLDAVVGYHPFERPKGEFLLLCRWPGNACESFRHSEPSGWVEAPSEARTLRVEVADFMEKRAVLNIPVAPDAAETPVPRASPKPVRGTIDLACSGTFLTLSARFTGAEPEPPSLAVNDTRDIRFVRVSDRLYQAGFVPEKGGAFRLRVTHPRVEPFEQEIHAFLRGETAEPASIGKVALHAGPDAPYGVLFAWAGTPQQLPPAPGRKLGEAFRIEPALSPICAPVELSFPMPADAGRPERVHVYWMRGTSWVCQETRREGGRLSISTHNLGTFVLCEDTQGPVISNVSPINGFRAQNRRPAITATVADTGSGIAGINVTLAGRWLLTAYDPERNRLVWERDEDLPSGRQELTIRVQDKAGNETEDRRYLVIP